MYLKQCKKSYHGLLPREGGLTLFTDHFFSVCHAKLKPRNNKKWKAETIAIRLESIVLVAS